jgi:hypothetical protein
MQRKGCISEFVALQRQCTYAQFFWNSQFVYFYLEVPKLGRIIDFSKRSAAPNQERRSLFQKGRVRYNSDHIVKWKADALKSQACTCREAGRKSEDTGSGKPASEPWRGLLDATIGQCVTWNLRCSCLSSIPCLPFLKVVEMQQCNLYRLEPKACYTLKCICLCFCLFDLQRGGRKIWKEDSILCENFIHLLI